MAVKIEDGKIVGLDESFEAHLGKIALRNMELNKTTINQIELVDGTTETNESVKLRSIRVAQALEKRDLKIGDVVVTCAFNHNDLPIPILASLYKGYRVLNLVKTFKERDYGHFLGLSAPKIIFCDPDIALTLKKSAQNINLNIEIVVFGDASETPEGFTNFSAFLKPTGMEDSFQAAEFDPRETIAFLACTSGTTGLPKCSAITHHNIAASMILPLIQMKFSGIEENSDIFEDCCVLSFSSLYWVSGITAFYWPFLLKMTRVHCKKPFSVELFAKGMNLYKPKTTLLSSCLTNEVMNSPYWDKIDFSCLYMLVYAGSRISDPLYAKLKDRIPNGTISNMYGLSEASGAVTIEAERKSGSCGKMPGWNKWKIIDPVTSEEISKPNVPGELCVKSETVFKGYYNNPEATRLAFTSDGYLKTGDILYYDNDGYFYVVDRHREMIKYRGYQVTPTELEVEIMNLPGVLACCVVGMPHPVDEEHPIAVVKLVEGATLTEDEIIQKVNENVCDSRRLRGGVILVKDIPMTPTGKIARKQVKDLVFAIKNIQTIKSHM